MSSRICGIDVTFGSENVLGLNDPDQWNCQIMYFLRSLLELQIRVSSDDELLVRYVTFTSVRSIQAPTSWRGANVHASSFESFLNAYATINHEDKELLLNVFLPQKLELPIMLFEIAQGSQMIYIYGNLAVVSSTPGVRVTVSPADCIR